MKLCFLGTGKINAKHVKILNKIKPDIHMSVASRELSRAGEFCSYHSLKKAFGTYEDAIFSDADTFVIGTPPKTHLKLIELCLKSHKNVVVEKPLVNSLEELEQVVSLTQKTSAKVLVAENQHYDPFHVKIKNILKNEDFGKPLYVYLTRLGYNNLPGWREDPLEMSYGAFHEGGVHWLRRLIDLSLIFEKGSSQGIESIQAFCPNLKPICAPREDTIQVIIRHSSGLTSNLLHSWAIPKRTGLFDLSRVLCEKGAIYFDGRGMFGLVFGPLKKMRFLKPEFFDLGGYKAMWRDFLKVLDHEKEPDLSLNDIVFDFRVMDAAYRSLSLKKPVTP